MKTHSIITIAASLVLASVSCSKLLDIPQKGVLNYDTYYSNDEEIRSAAIPLYTELRGNSLEFKLVKDLLSDDVYCGGSKRRDDIALEQLNEYTFDTENKYIEDMFDGYYTIINRANVIISHVDENYSDVARQVRAEARVFRAWAYFELITLWGNPPLVDHELSASEYNRPNAGKKTLWEFVENDLKLAIESGYLAEKASLNDTECYQVTRQFAQALLGKAYLWMATELSDDSFFAKSAACFDEVVSSGKYKLYDGDYALMQYNKHNCEVIFETNRIHDDTDVFYNYSIYESYIGWRYDRMNFGTAPVLDIYGFGFRIPKKELYDAFVSEEGAGGYRLNQTMKTYEQIRSLWGAGMKSGTSMISEGLFFYKQMPMKDDPEPGGWGMAYKNDIVWMRYAEVLLCGAEAHLRAGNAVKAQEYIDLVRERAGLSSKPVSMDLIKREKRLELCVEGVRFQDLLRWGEGYAALKDNGGVYPEMTANGQITLKSTGNETFGFKENKHEHLPYPAAEKRMNTALEQNTGWTN